jgi:alpha-N-arabinofuranosidase
MNHTIEIILTTLFAVSFYSSAAFATEFHVSKRGKDGNDGSASKPFKTISAAAQLAQPGDIVTVHEGVYRERVNPPRGGESDSKRIAYQAAPGEKVEIKGSELAKNWEKCEGDAWKTVIPNAFFGDLNPFVELIHGDWFDPKGREHHTGAVYLNGDWLTEAASLEEVLKPAGASPLWFGKADKDNTEIWAQFKGINPNDQLVEINVRRAVFYPDKPGRNYITVRGFIMSQAATQWAPPTAEQTAIIGTNWSKGWVIENNDISHSTCCGVSLGKHGDEFDNTSADTAEGYVKTIDRAIQHGWSKENIGGHVVRNNTISFCEQTGVVGSLGAVFSSITGNTIHDIHVRQLFSGAEMAGIKLHAAIDVEISGNLIYRTCRGIWLDWMAQGAHVGSNLLHDNIDEDLFVEVDHGPFLVENNIFLSQTTLLSVSQGGAYVHNLMAGKINNHHFDNRQTPFHKAHSTEIAGMHDNPCGDDRYYNNIFVERADLRAYDDAQLPVFMEGNVFLNGAVPSKHEKNPFVAPNDPGLKLAEKPDGLYLEFTPGDSWSGGEQSRSLVTSKLLGAAAVSGAPYEQQDGSMICIDSDYLGKKRNENNPAPGPFEMPGTSPTSIKMR